MESAGLKFTLSLVGFIFLEVLSRVGLYTTYVWSANPTAAMIIFVALCLAMCHPLVYVSFKGGLRSGRYLTNVLLSVFAPLNFVRPEREDTERFLMLYKCAHFLALVATTLHIYSWGRGQEWTVRFLAVSWPLFILSSAAAFAFCRLTLWPIYRHSRLSHPHMREAADREGSFPTDFDAMTTAVTPEEDEEGKATRLAPSVEEIVCQGHFYADPRLSHVVTACFCCGQVRRGPRGEWHLLGCAPPHEECSLEEEKEETGAKHDKQQVVVVISKDVP